MASKSSPGIAALAFALILPAGAFLLAVVARTTPQPGLAHAADAFVNWYASRMWTLWLLLLALPFVVLVTGGMALADGRTPRFPFVVTTLLSGVILAVVVLHMAAN